jgi:hypothetical protein
MRPLNLSALALAATIGLAMSAQAQTPPPPPPGAAPGGPAWRHDGAAGRPGMGERREARRAARLKALHDVLAIRPDQESAFQTFAAAMSPEPGRGAWGRGAGGWRPGEREGDKPVASREAASTPERLDLMLKRFDEREARMRAAIERRATATKALYAALSPEQQRTLDALPRLSGRGAWGGPEGMRGGRMDHGPGGPGPGAPGGEGD